MTAKPYEQARFNMIEQQIRPWEVLDMQVLELMGSMPREVFVPSPFQGLAYADIEIPLGNDQSMMFPKIEGRLLQALSIQPNDRVLEIGTGSGYLTACLANLAIQVISLEIDQELLTHAEACLKEQHVTNVELRCEDGLSGETEGGPFDVIAVTGSLPMIPDALLRQLNVGGRLFAVVGEAPAMEGTLVTRTGADSWHSEGLLETELTPLTNAPAVERFHF